MGVICEVMFTTRVKVIKMSKMAYFMYFLLNTIKISPYLSASERSYLSLSENTMDY